MPVLFEKPGRDKGQLVGRTPWLQPVHVQGLPSLIGATRAVKIAALTANSLHGALCQAGVPA
jgi:tRNA-2-methylthio-N6-dimethylallyladenosine synthase